jgi:hypothetical protein
MDGPLAPFAAKMIEHLGSLGYASDTAIRKMRLVGKVSRFLQETGRSAGDLGTATLGHAAAGRRSGVVRGQARDHPRLRRYLAALDPATEVPPGDLLPEPSHRIVPHIYTDEDPAKVLVAADHLNPEHRPDTYRHVISLVAVSGMRASPPCRPGCRRVRSTSRRVRSGPSRRPGAGSPASFHRDAAPWAG